MKEYVIGVDIGSTKSHLALFDIEGNFIDLGHWSCLNYENLPGLYTQFEDEFGQLVTGVLSKNGIGIKQISNAVLGVAGNDTEKQHAMLSSIVKRIGFEKFILVNDAYLGIPAGSRTGTGICAINGSGCTLAGLNKDGKTLQIGGVGYVSNDRGGGGTMSRFVVSAVYSELFRKAESTCMTPALMEYLNLSNKYGFIERVYDKIEEKSFDRTDLIRIMFQAAGKNDQVAMGFFREVAANYAGGISVMIDEMEFPPEEVLYIVLAGSVFVKGENPLLIDSLKEKVREHNPGHNINYVVLEVPPVAGAVFWALNAKSEYYDKVCSELRNYL